MIYLLHISDLHLVADPQWNNMKNAILNSVQETLRNVPLGQKLLVITGDFHNFSQDNFEYAEEFIPSLADVMEIDLAKDVFVIPGNHDVSNHMPEEIDREALLNLIKSKPEKLYQGKRLENLLACYKSYAEFVKKIGVYKETDGLTPVSSHVRTWRDKLHLLHLNTTLIADGSEKNRQMTDTRSATSQEIRDQLRRGNLPCIAIGHNSFYDLEERQRNELAGLFLQEGISAYLCGDRHQKNHKREEKKIILGEDVTIPNVVAYRASADERDTYSDFGMIWHMWDENSGKIQMKFMRWDPEDQGGLWEDGRDSYDLRRTSALKEEKAGEPAGGKSGLYGSDSCWYSNDILTARGKGTVSSFLVQKFLEGGRCRWEMVFADDVLAERNIVDDLYRKAVAGGTYVLLAPGGEGKTTALMQMSVKLIRDGRNVFYYRGYGLSELTESIPENSVFVLDNPPEKPKFKRFLEKVIEEGITLIIAARENEWNLLKNSLGISGRDIQEVHLEKLTPKEAWAFTDCVRNNLRLSRKRKEIKEIFLDNSYGFLYAAMLMAVKNADSLETIAQEIIKNLSQRSHEGLLLLAHIVLAEKCEAKFTREYFRKVCGRLGISPQDGNNALSREALLNGENYQTRHTVISNLFYEELFSDHGILSQDDIDDILTCLVEMGLKQYSMHFVYRYLRDRAADEIMRLCRALPMTSMETCQALINRMLDEIKIQAPSFFHKLPLCIKDEEVQLLFFRKCFEREWISSDFLQRWCELLLRKGAPWDVAEEYSPAWIFRKACVEQGGDSAAWRIWAKIETQENNAGEYARENTARWIYREACLNREVDSHTWLVWAKLEEQEDNIGECEKENTARWIYREACLKREGDSDVWLAWARLEEQENNIGECEKENTARWIYRQACMNHDGKASVWFAWGRLEEQQNNMGEYEKKNTARWIYREACLKRGVDSSVWLAWGQLEERENNPGEYERENTARWIYREACLKRGVDSSVWLAWGQLEERENNIGECEKENTARWIYRQACMNHDEKASVWFAWGRLEEQQNNMGEYDQENTARWILHEGIKRFPNDGSLYSLYSNLELIHHSPERARDILRKYVLYNNRAINNLAILEYYNGNIDSDNEYCTVKLVKKMEAAQEKTLGSILYLYYCSLLLGRKEEAKHYYRQIQQHPDYDSIDNTWIKEYIRLCKKAVIGESDTTEIPEIFNKKDHHIY